MQKDPRRQALLERALKFECFVIQPRPANFMWDLEGRREYRTLPFALCYKLEPGETPTGLMNELIALKRMMTVADALRPLSNIEIEEFVIARTENLLLLEDDPYFTKVRVSALYEESSYHFTQAIAEFPVAWQWNGPPVEQWQPLDARTKFPRKLMQPPPRPSDAPPPPTDRFDALEFVDPVEAAAQLDKSKKAPTFTSIPAEAQLVKAIPRMLAEAIKQHYGDMAKARSWPSAKKPS